MARRNTYYEEVICSGLGRYIQKEYLKATDELGDVFCQGLREVMRGRVHLRQAINICIKDAPLVSFKPAPFNP